ncbi:MAG: SelB C-terminal domain-containing protein, partial [Oxalicibacterium faecigallinarum]|uniref:SelB domain-containing protein n=1 Tax=Oxalicibacterium faecigallinarum TaxID=573741 RepID=UPI00280A4D5F
RMAKAGEVYQIVKDLYYHPDVVQQLADLAKQIGTTDGKVTAARYRDATGLGRKRAIQILEFFDRIGFLRRVGDEHLLRPGSILFQK